MTQLKKIKVVELRLGMFLHGFDGPWLKHPFWRSTFLLTEAADLRAAQQCGLDECWIDTARSSKKRQRTQKRDRRCHSRSRQAQRKRTSRSVSSKNYRGRD